MPPSTSLRRNATKKPETSVDELSNKLASGLKISKAEPRRKVASKPTPETQKALSMRAVNAASKSLFEIVESGWKHTPESARGTRFSTANTHAAAAATHLSILRKLCPNDIDIERAALSVLGKLSSLEMYDVALPALIEMHNSLCSVLDVQAATSKLHVLSLPIPSAPPSDPTILTLLSNYLLHAVTIVAHITCRAPAPRRSPPATLSDLANILSNEHTLLSWLPVLSPLPVKHLDFILTRTYSVLTKSLPSLGDPQAMFRIRMHALCHLVYTSPGTVGNPDALWDQPTRYASSYIKSLVSSPSTSTSEDDAVLIIVQAFSQLVNLVVGSTKAELLMKGNAFSSYCEYWMELANRTGNITLVNHIASLINSTAQSPTVNACSPDESQFNLSQLYATVLKATNDLTKLDGPNTQLDDVQALLASFKTHLASTESLDVDSKTEKALERLRRALLQALETNPSLECVGPLLGLVVDILELRVARKFDRSGVNKALDTLFTLSRVQLRISTPSSYILSHNTLSRAAVVLDGAGVGLQEHERANFLRCISGTFHNLGGQLYQAGRYASAISFLDDGCQLGTKALTLHKSSPGIVEDESLLNAWMQLETQLYRRWQLLGLCNAKIGDRRPAQDAYVEAIRAFPYTQVDFARLAKSTPNSALFASTPALKELGLIIDKVTYQGLCDLMLPASQISLRASHPEIGINGALLERQVDCLLPAFQKGAVKFALPVLLQDAIELYGSGGGSIHRVRLLLKVLSLGYILGPEPFERIGRPDAICDEIEKSLKVVGTDVTYADQYRGTAYAWYALHAHRCGHEQQMSIVEGKAAQVCEALRALLGPKPSVPSKENLAKAPVAGKAKVNVRVVKSKRAPTKEPVTPKARPRKALQDVPLNTTVECNSTNSTPNPVFDQPESLLDVLESLTHVLGFLSLLISKIHVLDIMRRIAEVSGDALSDRYVSVTARLAQELLFVGKTRRSTKLFNQLLPIVKRGTLSSETCVLFFLRFAEVNAGLEQFQESTTLYEDAMALSGKFNEDKGLSPVQKVQLRVHRIEQVAMAFRVLSFLRLSQHDTAGSLDALLQSLRLWNRAYDTLTKLQPAPQKVAEDDPFQDSPKKSTTPSNAESSQPKQTFAPRAWMDNAGWRISQGLLTTFFALCRMYTACGSVREATFFAQQAEELAMALNAPAMTARALTWKAELELNQGLTKDGCETLECASRFLQYGQGVDQIAQDGDILELVEIKRLVGQYELDDDSEAANESARKILLRLDETLGAFDGLAFGPRTSVSGAEIIVPDIFGRLLRDRIWRLRDEGGPDFDASLETFLSLPETSESKAEENNLISKLTLNEIYKRFRTDMFLSSLPESTIGLPLGTSNLKIQTPSVTALEILKELETAEQLLWETMRLSCHRGSVSHVRDATLRLALVRTFQASLGKAGADRPLLTVNLMDASSALTLRREMSDAILHKFQSMTSQDDLQFPTLSSVRQPPQKIHGSIPNSPTLDSDDEDLESVSLKAYWESVQNRYQSRVLDYPTLSKSRLSSLPENWSVVHVSVTEDNSTMFITRQYGGGEESRDLAFCVPLRGRRDDEDDADHLTFQDVLNEFADIIKCSNDTTKAAVHIKGDDEEARSKWWKERGALDTRLKELLENIEFCWLGAFKTILSQRPALSPDEIVLLRTSFDRAFQRGLHLQDKKTKQKALGHRKVASDYQAPNRVTLDDALMECFSTLSIHCRDEELEDLVYFVLDLYQFHGVPVAVAEIDVDQVVVDLRTALEEHSDRMKKRNSEHPKDDHIFLVLDKNIQGLPWENLPILRGQSVSRIPSVEFLIDRLEFVQWRRKTENRLDETLVDRAIVDPKKGYYVLNPSGDLGRTQARFQDWAKDMESVGWQGITGRAPSELQFLNALENNDLVVYFGHGGGEQYVRSHKIRHLPRCAAVMLWGCSSGFLRGTGNFDRTGTPYHYMVSGCPTLVANLWDVTDRDIDKFSQSVFDKINLDSGHIRQWRSGDRGSASVVQAVAQSRDVCKLKYLTGAAPVVYGIPFYL